MAALGIVFDEPELLEMEHPMTCRFALARVATHGHGVERRDGGGVDDNFYHLESLAPEERANAEPRCHVRTPGIASSSH